VKIQIIGGSGTGKSTLAKFISEKENIKWIDTDNYLWKDDSFKENNPIEKRKEMYQKDMELGDNYVVSGSVFSWCPKGFSDRDVLVFLFLDEAVRMERLRNREMDRGMWLDENGKYTNDFLEWCKTYLTEEDKSMAGTYAEQSYQMELSKSPVLKLDSSRPVEELYAEIKSKSNQ
jgi:adenylate kinase family enzyme